MKKCIILIITIVITSCNSNEKYDYVKWQEQGDLKMYTHRKFMLNDITENYELKGLSYKQLINLLGKPDSSYSNEKSFLYYDIENKYGNDIDPVYTKTLELKLKKDSTIDTFFIKEWKK